MTNYLGIATVTEAIRQLLETEIKNEIDPGLVASSTTPDKAASGSHNKKLNLFLYHVTPNTGYKNMDLPMRNFDGQFVKNPQIALDLHYLLTAYSDSNSDDLLAQKMLATAMRTLEENSILTRDYIATLKTNANVGGTDLDTQVEIIKVSIENLSLEEISKLWSSFFQTNYRISVFYKATVVLLDGKQQPKYPLPVKDRFVYVSPFNQPFIEKIDPQILELTAGAYITLSGRNMKSDGVQIMFDNVSQTPLPANVTENQIIIDVPQNITPGIKQVKIINPYVLDKSSFKETMNLQSNVVSFVLAPMITDGLSPPNRAKTFTVAQGGNLTLNFQPAIGPDQKVSVLIGDTIFSSPQIDTTTYSNLTITIPTDFPIGQNYLLRLRVDDVENLLVTNNVTNDPNYGKYIQPNVTVIV